MKGLNVITLTVIIFFLIVMSYAFFSVITRTQASPQTGLAIAKGLTKNAGIPTEKAHDCVSDPRSCYANQTSQNNSAA